MATVKVACPKCGQRVSGDESFFGHSVECPVCSAEIQFPGEKRGEQPNSVPIPIPARDEDEKPDPIAEATAEEPSGFRDSSFEDEPVPSRKEEKTNEKGESSKPETEPPLDLPERPSAPSPIFGAISIVSAVLALVTCVFGMLFCPIAIIFGHVSQAKARRSLVQPAPGQTLGAMGMLIGYVWLIVTILILALAVLFKEQLAELLEGFNAAAG